MSIVMSDGTVHENEFNMQLQDAYQADEKGINLGVPDSVYVPGLWQNELNQLAPPDQYPESPGPTRVEYAANFDPSGTSINGHPLPSIVPRNTPGSPTVLSDHPRFGGASRRTANDNKNLQINPTPAQEAFLDQSWKQMGRNVGDKPPSYINEIYKREQGLLEREMQRHFDETVTVPFKKSIDDIDKLRAAGDQLLGKGNWNELSVARYNKLGKEIVGKDWEDVPFK